MHSWLANQSATRDVLDEFGLSTKHRLGQNFLVDDTVIGRILDLAELDPSDVVLEVGPGIGTLTVAMLPRAGAVCAVEADRQLEPVLAETCAQDSERLNLVMGDALRVIPDGLPLEPGKFVSNLPYQVAATLILKVFSEVPSVRRAVVMVQAEVADRICAAPGSKKYGAYTAKLQIFGRVTGRFEVGPGNFMPPPHVDSAVVRIDRSPLVDPMAGAPCMPEKISRLESVIDAAFSQRRKTLRNAMGKSGFAKETLASAFEASGIDPAVRAETLSVERFCALEEALEAAGAFSEEPHGAR
ncbi:MAG: 16S rRNA (adenine(1518)-N(6)/adenine(1519)-N(6))-dimethyltransferase RsmA [Atopobiaceae bacterium]|nr:16S rRNA (adenine(1518)-N(6)/adenine(1519)-N(6))-dimethyltransferase RsmA [Atopobiaceae bacterium]